MDDSRNFDESLNKRRQSRNLPENLLGLEVVVELSGIPFMSPSNNNLRTVGQIDFDQVWQIIEKNV